MTDRPDPPENAEPPSGTPARPPAARAARARRVARVAFAVVASFLAAALLVAAGALTALRLQYTGDPHTEARSRGRDALWLGHAWVDGRKTDADLAALAARLRDTGIRDLYVHTGPLAYDGTLNPAKYPRARWFTDAVRAAVPGIRIQAWLGQAASATEFDLRSADTRTRAVASAVQVLDAGYDGVHFDVEPVRDGNRDYLDMLARAREALRARGAMLSVAAHQVEPAGNLVTLIRLAGGERTKWWTPGYFREIASRVDQIAVMAYDSGLPTRGLFGGYVTRQTELALELTPPGTDLLIGLPFFHDQTIGHHENAEKAGTAARAVRIGLGDSARRNFGVALYVDFAATEADWAAYREEWFRP